MISYSTSVRPIVAAVSMVPVVGLVIVGPVVVETYIYIYMYVYLIFIAVSPRAKKLCRMQDAEYLKNL